MSAHERIPGAGRRSLLSWLGIQAESGESPVEEVGPAKVDSGPRNILHRMRRQILEEIGVFLDAHDLPPNPFTLTAAHDYVTASDMALVRAIDSRVHEHQPLTAEWLEQAGQESGRGDERHALNLLMKKLESNLDDLGQTTNAARNAASDYSLALEAHVDGLGEDAPGPQNLAEIVSLARAMLARTRELERDMARSELQARTLKRSLDQARRSADRDHLTGLPNRRAFEQTLSSEIALARAEKQSLCVAFVDIDHFKAVNDTHGHEAGDRVLKSVAQNLSRISDDRCHVARHGGEEFVVLFRGIPLNAAWELLDDARQLQADRRLINRATDVPFGKITFSGGLADVFAHADPRAALRAADEALYKAKEDGRNRICVAPREQVG